MLSRRKLRKQLGGALLALMLLLSGTFAARAEASDDQAPMMLSIG